MFSTLPRPVRRVWTSLLFSLVLLGLAACSDEPDAQVPDVPDTSLSDTDAPDTDAPDADAPDADAPDADAPDADAPDTDAPDGDIPDASSEPDADSTEPTPDCAFFSDDFSSGDTSHEEGGFRWGTTNFDVTSDFGHGDSQALRFTYGPDAPGEDSTSELRFEIGRQVDEFWLEHWIYYPTGDEADLGSARYVHRDDESSDNNKYLRVWRGDYGSASPKVGASTRPTGAGAGGDAETSQGNSALHNEFVKDGGLIGNWGSGDQLWVSDGDQGAIQRGQWSRVRMHFRLSEPGAATGIARWWIDDELVYEFTEARNAAVDAADNYVERGYIQGWANSGFSELTHVYIDDFSICDTDPGW